jgi:ERCC4-type nuclease
MKIICDTREKHPYSFTDKFGNYLECEHRKLNTGDYSIEGYEDLLCIERKESVTELAGNCVAKRFIRELERMQSYKYKYLILEFSLNDILEYPRNLRLPPRIKNRIKVSGMFILTRICQWSIDYDFDLLACGNRQNAQNMTMAIINKVIEQEKNNGRKSTTNRCVG